MHEGECVEGHHGPDAPEKASCPFCSRPERIDVGAPTTCAMCGMAITHPDLASTIDAGAGSTLFFCSIWCLRIYRREKTAEAHRGVAEAWERFKRGAEDGA